jgi:hypothetical protein
MLCDMCESVQEQQRVHAHPCMHAMQCRPLVVQRPHPAADDRLFSQQGYSRLPTQACNGKTQTGSDYQPGGPQARQSPKAQEESSLLGGCIQTSACQLNNVEIQMSTMREIRYVCPCAKHYWRCVGGCDGLLTSVTTENSTAMGLCANVYSAILNRL